MVVGGRVFMGLFIYYVVFLELVIGVWWSGFLVSCFLERRVLGLRRLVRFVGNFFGRRYFESFGFVFVEFLYFCFFF